MHLWIRRDAARFVRPGFDPADVFPTLGRAREEARRRAEAAQDAEDAALAAKLEEWRRGHVALCAEVNELNAEMARRRAACREESKYSPSQPRVPAGNPRGGQWTDPYGGQGTAQATGQDAAQDDVASVTQPMGNVDIGDVSGPSELGDLFSITPADMRIDAVQLAANDGPIQINPDELINRHILDEHIGKTDEELIARIRGSQLRGFIYTIGMDRNGSFDSIESARDLISQTLKANSEAAQRIAAGQEEGLFVTYRFGYRTGKEAYLDVETSRITIRPTYEVGVQIVHDDSRTSGYRVVSAYPRNYNPRIGR